MGTRYVNRVVFYANLPSLLKMIHSFFGKVQPINVTAESSLPRLVLQRCVHYNLHFGRLYKGYVAFSESFENEAPVHDNMLSIRWRQSGSVI